MQLKFVLLFAAGVSACAPWGDGVYMPPAPTVTSAPIAPGLIDGCGDAPSVGKLLGRVYPLPIETRRLPDFDALAPAGDVCLDRLDVSERRGYPSFPGIANRFEWFGVDLTGAFTVANPGSYVFRLASDDGSKLFIDGAQVVDDDGYHVTIAKNGVVDLAPGTHTIEVKYWQGPGPLALSLEVAPANGTLRVFRIDQGTLSLILGLEKSMSLTWCPECKKEISTRAMACPQCGVPLRMRARVAAVLAVAVIAGAGVAAIVWSLRRDDYARVDELRTEQDLAGTHDEHVKQRFFRLYKQHPNDAMYIYLWARCEDDPNKQLELAKEGIAADPRFAWSYNIESRALARLGRIGEALDAANKGESLDPGNYELSRKIAALKTMTSHKLVDQPKLAAGAHVTYHGLVRSMGRPEHADVAAIEKNRAPSPKRVEDSLANVIVCTNPFADACVRAYVAREESRPLKEHELVAVTGDVVANDDGEPILLADSVAVEPP